MTMQRYYACGDGEYRSLSELGSISFVCGRAVAIIETNGRERIQVIDMDDCIDIVEEESCEV